MKKLIDRITAIGLYPENASFTISSGHLLKAISEEVDFETITDHELREIVFIVCKALNRMDWKAVVTHAVKHLPFGLNQTGIAFEGSNPCEGCPDAMIEASRCYHDQECKAWEIYEARF
jgi:hypothetical protein